MNRTPEQRNRPEPISFLDSQSMTKQSFAKDANINNIMAKYIKTGVPPAAGTRQPNYGDFTDGADYRENIDRILDAQTEFAKLDSDLRKQFNNDPSVMLDFMSNPANLEECQELGLLPKAAEPITPEVAPVAPLEIPPEPTTET